MDAIAMWTGHIGRPLFVWFGLVWLLVKHGFQKGCLSIMADIVEECPLLPAQRCDDHINNISGSHMFDAEEFCNHC